MAKSEISLWPLTLGSAELAEVDPRLSTNYAVSTIVRPM